MIKVAITGNIAAGKSAVQKIIQNQGYFVLDTDNCAHELLANSPDVKDVFGTNDRVELSKVVFQDKNKLKKLESILHPLVKGEILDFFKKHSSQKAVFVVVPQLFEAGFESLFDKIIFVNAPYKIRLKRLIDRNGYSKEYAITRLNSQMDENLKIPHCDYVIDNSTTFEDLEQKTKECLRLLV